MSQWYAVRSSTRRERSAFDELTEAGFAVFMPCETLLRRLARDYELVSRPLFPGYLFVLCEPEDFGEIRALQSIHAFVCADDEDGVPRPMAIPLPAIIVLQAEERAGFYDRTRVRPPYRPKKGEKVKITAGPWQSFMAKVLTTPSGKRARLMVEGPFDKEIKVAVDYLSAA